MTTYCKCWHCECAIWLSLILSDITSYLNSNCVLHCCFYKPFACFHSRKIASMLMHRTLFSINFTMLVCFDWSKQLTIFLCTFLVLGMTVSYLQWMYVTRRRAFLAAFNVSTLLSTLRVKKRSVSCSNTMCSALQQLRLQCSTWRRILKREKRTSNAPTVPTSSRVQVW